MVKSGIVVFWVVTVLWVPTAAEVPACTDREAPGEGKEKH